MKAYISCTLAVALVTTSLAGIAPAAAQTAPGMDDLIGARGSSIDGALAGRGYALATNKGVAQMWWNSSTKKCISVVVDNGRASSIQSASAKDCGHNGGDDAVAGVVAGAVAVGLIAALSGHHKDNNNRNNNASYNGEYQRGYNDGMYGGNYATNDSEGYHSGYMAGEAERNNRRHANSNIARRLPAAAREVCLRKGESDWGVYPGDVSVVSSSSYSPGSWSMTLASGHWRATCEATDRGQLLSYSPN